MTKDQILEAISQRLELNGPDDVARSMGTCKSKIYKALKQANPELATLLRLSEAVGMEVVVRKVRCVRPGTKG